MLSQIGFLQPAVGVVYNDHERRDELGSPEGSRGKEIPQAARIFVIIDQWDVLASDRPYRKAWEREIVTAYFQDNSGKIYDPEIVSVFVKII